MEGDEENSLIFRSDDLEHSKSNGDNRNPFVKVIKNPFLRWMLRTKKYELKTEKPEKPKEKPIEKIEKKPKPQLRAMIRISTKKMKNASSGGTKTTIIVLSILLIISVIISGFFSYKLILEKNISNGQINSSAVKEEILKLFNNSSSKSKTNQNVEKKMEKETAPHNEGYKTESAYYEDLEKPLKSYYDEEETLNVE